MLLDGSCDEADAGARMIQGMEVVGGNRYISRYHFMTYMQGDKLVMRDFSLNQTKIGDDAVKTDADQPTVLGDEFDLSIPNPDEGGKLTFTVHCKKQ
ncbi:MAG: hypothetical protein HQK52_21520 [Oligoflexia bacterium]|nr:hypothetical protein [Oligoflexia bacterium]